MCVQQRTFGVSHIHFHMVYEMLYAFIRSETSHNCVRTKQNIFVKERGRSANENNNSNTTAACNGTDEMNIVQRIFEIT